MSAATKSLEQGGVFNPWREAQRRRFIPTHTGEALTKTLSSGREELFVTLSDFGLSAEQRTNGLTVLSYRLSLMEKDGMLTGIGGAKAGNGDLFHVLRFAEQGGIIRVHKFDYQLGEDPSLAAMARVTDIVYWRREGSLMMIGDPLLRARVDPDLRKNSLAQLSGLLVNVDPERTARGLIIGEWEDEQAKETKLTPQSFSARPLLGLNS